MRWVPQRTGVGKSSFCFRPSSLSTCCVPSTALSTGPERGWECDVNLFLPPVFLRFPCPRPGSRQVFQQSRRSASPTLLALTSSQGPRVTGSCILAWEGSEGTPHCLPHRYPRSKPWLSSSYDDKQMIPKLSSLASN